MINLDQNVVNDIYNYFKSIIEHYKYSKNADGFCKWYIGYIHSQILVNSQYLNENISAFNRILDDFYLFIK